MLFVKYFVGCVLLSLEKKDHILHPSVEISFNFFFNF